MSELLQAGLNITAIGMGVVFILLTMMVFIIRGMSALALRIAPPAPAGKHAAAQNKASPALRDEQLVSVISAAVTMHRHRRKE